MSAPRRTGLLACFVLGVAFGTLLTKGELVSWFRINEMFRFAGHHMFGVFALAIPVAIVTVQGLKRGGARTLEGDPVRLEPKVMGRGIRYVAGGLLFGCGWALTGACPGPLFALLGAGAGGGVMLVAIAAALAGAWTYGVLRPPASALSPHDRPSLRSRLTVALTPEVSVPAPIRRLFPAAALLAAHVVIALVAPSARAELAPAAVSGWTVKHVVTLPGSPERAYDAATGDLLPWWDHRFKADALRFYIEPWAGGGMYEIWNEEGEGVKHATVIMADRGKTLRFEGPLGLAGNALVFVTTWDFAAKGDSTVLTCNASVAGVIAPGVEKAVDGVWQHFLSGRLKSYMESGKDLQKKRWPRTK